VLRLENLWVNAVWRDNYFHKHNAEHVNAMYGHSADFLMLT